MMNDIMEAHFNEWAKDNGYIKEPEAVKITEDEFEEDLFDAINRDDFTKMLRSFNNHTDDLDETVKNFAKHLKEVTRL